jgi:acyl-coenzyme A synthetase/AMP-(fatty) acid ligase
MTLFWTHKSENLEITYEELVEDINTQRELPKYVYRESTYETLRDILHAFAVQKPITVLDPDFSDEKLIKIGIHPADIDGTHGITSSSFESSEELRTTILNSGDNEILRIYTAGTTGTPDSVQHSLNSLINNVKKGPKFEDNVWGFAYNPTHFAGLQVLFQAFLNENPMVYLFQEPTDDIVSAIRSYGVTHLSATPTFYRLRISSLSEEFESVRRITQGGESFDPGLLPKLRNIFPNAEFRNVYALTEAGSLMESDGEIFSIPDNIEDKVRIMENELQIHESLLTETDAAEIDGEWFQTGDQVEFVDDERFRFTGRQSDLVNISGYQVDPLEVESTIESHPSVIAATVRARSNSVTGNLLVTDIQVSSNNASETIKQELRSYIKDRLQDWEQPRMINIVDEIEKTRSGKKLR